MTREMRRGETRTQWNMDTSENVMRKMRNYE